MQRSLRYELRASVFDVAGSPHDSIRGASTLPTLVGQHSADARPIVGRVSGLYQCSAECRPTSMSTDISANRRSHIDRQIDRYSIEYGRYVRPRRLYKTLDPFLQVNVLKMILDLGRLSSCTMTERALWCSFPAVRLGSTVQLPSHKFPSRGQPTGFRSCI